MDFEDVFKDFEDELDAKLKDRRNYADLMAEVRSFISRKVYEPSPIMAWFLEKLPDIIRNIRTKDCTYCNTCLN
jgi:hypothetical protein